MNKYVKWISIVAILGIIAYFVGLPFLNSKENPKEAPGETKSSPRANSIPVNAVVVKPKKVENKITLTGSIVANESVELKSEISGRIEKIYFKEGTRVKDGDLLVSINDDELRAEAEKLKYTKKLREEEEFRQRRLLEREAISQQDYDLALTELNTVKADIKLVAAQLDKTKLRAPFDGVIGLRHVSEGSYITPSDPIASLFNINPAKIDFSIPGKYSNEVKKGDKIYFSTEASDKEREGIVYAIEPRIDPNTRTLSMRALSPNDDGKLLPGQFAKIELIFNTVEDAIMVPSEAVIPELGGHKVYLSKDGHVQVSKVNIGIRTENELEITSGINPNDTLITTGVLQVRPGANVNLNILN